ncbi:MAG: 3-mercaptopyruvate sulfurtransferase [Beijerinckiaceae bacterium]|nr:3-mercaptopyruvate sulfurtransferase [Beijerinckiaceae bacterium]
MKRQPPLVSADWLHQNLNADDVVIIDTSWYLPVHKRDGKAEYAQAHIPGAVFFDIDLHSDTSSSLPHMLPSPAQFAAAVGALGVSNDSHVVVYDGMGLFASPRLWWMFQVFGHDAVSVLDGGLPGWKAKGFETSSDLPAPVVTTFTPRFRKELVADMQTMTAALGSEQVLDARPAGRFQGVDPEFRPGLSSGHMPGAHNLPQSTLVENGFLLPPPKLLEAFEGTGIDIDRPVITTCGSGMSAATLTLALAVLGKPIGQLYDGSWTEWAGTPGNPIEKHI